MKISIRSSIFRRSWRDTRTESCTSHPRRSDLIPGTHLDWGRTNFSISRQLRGYDRGWRERERQDYQYYIGISPRIKITSFSSIVTKFLDSVLTLHIRRKNKTMNDWQKIKKKLNWKRYQVFLLREYKTSISTNYTLIAYIQSINNNRLKV